MSLHVGTLWLSRELAFRAQQADNVCRWQARTYLSSHEEVPELFGALGKGWFVGAKNCARLAKF
jgi:hypothetical protein